MIFDSEMGDFPTVPAGVAESWLCKISVSHEKLARTCKNSLNLPLDKVPTNSKSEPPPSRFSMYQLVIETDTTIFRN